MSRILLTRQDAAEQLSVSLDHFEKHWQPHMRLVRSGRLRLVPASEIEREVRRRQEFAR